MERVERRCPMRWNRVAAVVLLLSLVGMGSLAPAASKKSLEKRYVELLEQTDALWAEYKKADKLYHEKSEVSRAAHLRKLADLHDRLSALHQKWSEFQVSEEMFSTDMKVGLVLELQQAAITAEIVGLADEDQEFLNLSDNLDQKYEKVVDSM
jgi:hypothetical protein